MVPDPEAFIRARLPLAEVPGTGLRLHLARPDSGLARLVPVGGAPYWAHAWPGGAALAAHVLAHPHEVAGRTVLDLGAGSGIAGIAAARASAREVLLADADPLAAVAARLNAEANGAAVTTRTADLLDGLGTSHEVVLAGDLFYEAALARRAATFLDRCAGAVLVGDVGRAFLPRDRLHPLAAYPVRDVGDPPGAPLREGWVYRWVPLERGEAPRRAPLGSSG